MGRIQPTKCWVQSSATGQTWTFRPKNYKEGKVLIWSNVQLNHQEIQDFAHRSLGRFFIAFANVELNLSLQVGGAGKFQDKLERFYEMAIAEYPDSEKHFCEISAWYMAADSMRTMRNRFAHGRWGFHTHAQSIVHVAGYPPAPQDERRFSLPELDSIVKDAELLGEELLKMAMR